MKRVTVRLSSGGKVMDVRLRKDEWGWLHIHARTMRRIREWLGDGPINVERIGGEEKDEWVYDYKDVRTFTEPIPGYVAFI